MKSLPTINFFGFELLRCSKSELKKIFDSSKPITVNTINPHSFVEQLRNSDFKKALSESDYLLPDGIGVCLAVWATSGIRLKKIAGYDLFEAAMKYADNNHLSVMFVGSNETVLRLIMERSKVQFPCVSVFTFSPPYKQHFADADVKKLVFKINKVSPDILFLGLTAPKQELLSHYLKLSENTKLVAGIGAVFDFYAGTVSRPKKIWISLGLEWLIRLLAEPRRLWKRTFISIPKFIFYVLISSIKGTERGTPDEKNDRNASDI
jgi:N-acetylglucosaminyldiphosphoundecaprenol N-acetyl-beta-D-mannosaminyltransferase